MISLSGSLSPWVKGFFNWLFDEGLIDSNPGKQVMGQPEHQPHFFLSEHVWYPRPTARTAERHPPTADPYRTRLYTDVDPDTIGIHFWLDDYQFETTSNRPQKTLQGLSRFKIVLTPDFSIYRDWPLALKLFNVYRSRWCGCLWHEAGFSVIPSVSWGYSRHLRLLFPEPARTQPAGRVTGGRAPGQPA